MFIFVVMTMWLATLGVAHAQVISLGSPVSSPTGSFTSATVGPTQAGVGAPSLTESLTFFIKPVSHRHRANAWRQFRSLECA